MNEECKTCVKRKTQYCPNSSECLETENKPYYQNKIMLLNENQELKKQIGEVEFIVGLRQKRNLISKFDKEYDEEDKKKNPNRDYAGIMPDAEEIYRRYYTMKNQQKEFIEYLQNNIESLEFCDNEFILSNHKKEVKAYKEILLKYKEIIDTDINVGERGDDKKWKQEHIK